MSGSDIVAKILTDRAPAPAGHYTQATVSGGHVYISGQLPILPDGQQLPDDGFEAQATQAIENMLAILDAAGSTPRHLLKVTAYIVGVANWPRFNAVYAAMLPDARPARTVVPVPELHYGFLVEIDAIAALAGSERTACDASATGKETGEAGRSQPNGGAGSILTSSRGGDGHGKPGER
ncbi:reactive intermediate/imine deaminase [Sphingomonas oleivorans]|uniref:Reactive intermediate/imine deaminase n=1 Tax=Sphingomonas oleivorans TaxID=1735121 RepID=A0A2T5FZK6_9SPHN|nr:reactive intermediate/imine deaminase [Sphingomonas oleivorans]